MNFDSEWLYALKQFIEQTGQKTNSYDPVKEYIEVVQEDDCIKVSVKPIDIKRDEWLLFFKYIQKKLYDSTEGVRSVFQRGQVYKTDMEAWHEWFIYSLIMTIMSQACQYPTTYNYLWVQVKEAVLKEIKNPKNDEYSNKVYENILYKMNQLEQPE